MQIVTSITAIWMMTTMGMVMQMKFMVPVVHVIQDMFKMIWIVMIIVHRLAPLLMNSEILE